LISGASQLNLPKNFGARLNPPKNFGEQVIRIVAASAGRRIWQEVLPMAVRREGSHERWVMTAVDRDGRLADRSVPASLDWPPRRVLKMSVHEGALLVRSDSAGTCTVTKQGHLRLPAETRRLLRLEAGSRLLIAVCVKSEALISFPIPLLEEMLLSSIREAVERR
jgi:hypothetical protein